MRAYVMNERALAIAVGASFERASSRKEVAQNAQEEEDEEEEKAEDWLCHIDGCSTVGVMVYDYWHAQLRLRGG